MLLLAFDTATAAVTVAVRDDERVLAEVTRTGARQHGELLVPSITEALASAGATREDVTAIAAGVGPGPYTGLRVGVVTARVLGAVLGVPVAGVCTLDVIARGAAGATSGREFLVATDARRREVYWARYSALGQRLAGPFVGPPTALGTAADPAAPVAGEGPWLYPEVFSAPVAPRYPSASALADLAFERIGADLPLLPAQPLYLRRPDARVPGPPKRVLPS